MRSKVETNGAEHWLGQAAWPPRVEINVRIHNLAITYSRRNLLREAAIFAKVSSLWIRDSVAAICYNAAVAELDAAAFYVINTILAMLLLILFWSLWLCFSSSYRFLIWEPSFCWQRARPTCQTLIFLYSANSILKIAKNNFIIGRAQAESAAFTRMQ